MKSFNLTKNKTVNSFLLILSYIICWLTVFFAVSSFFSYSPSKNAYGILSAWWAALYFSCLFKIKLKNVLKLFLIGVLAITLAFIIGKESFNLINILEPQAVFLSPAILNLLIMSIKEAVIRKLSPEKE